MNMETRIWVASVLGYVAAAVIILVAGEAMSPDQLNVALF
ncbi:hypothetical protein SAMN05518865_101502 [Duganella sp. CF458]|nr:hypothetical protein SAMN05518865_101502 [Duganella sp. CF458]